MTIIFFHGLGSSSKTLKYIYDGKKYILMFLFNYLKN